MSVLMKKTLRAALCLLLCALCLPLLRAPARAADEHHFYLSAQNASGLLIAPAKVSYTDGQSIAEALLASPYEFTGLTASGGRIQAIEGTELNTVYVADFVVPNSQLLTQPAANITCIRFGDFDAGGVTLTDAQKTLLQTMADYQDYDAEVRAAARSAYDEAADAYLTADGDDALRLAGAITKAAEDYQENLKKPYTVTFTLTGGTDYAITAENEYGRVYTSDDGRTLALPKGTYTWTATTGARGVSGELTVDGPSAVNADILQQSWLDTAQTRLSSVSGTTRDHAEFDASQYELTPDGNTICTAISDSFIGSLYLYQPLTGEAPNSVTLTVLYTGTDGRSYVRENFGIGVYNQSLASVLARGGAGNTVTIRARMTDPETGFTQFEDAALTITRRLTLKDLSVTADGKTQGAGEAFAGDTYEYTYNILSSVSTVRVAPTPTANNYAYTIAVGGDVLSTNEPADVPISGNTDVTVTVSADSAESTTYTLHFCPSTGKTVKLRVNKNEGITAKLFNSAGSAIEPVSSSVSGTYRVFTYELAASREGEPYTYIATKDKVYHATQTFSCKDTDTDKTYTITVQAADWLSGLQFANSLTGEVLYPLDKTLAGAAQDYTIFVPDSTSTLYITATRASSAPTTVKCAALYNKLSTNSADVPATVSVQTDGKNAVRLSGAFLYTSAYGNTLTIRVSRTINGANTVTHYTDYTVNVCRTLSLKDLSASLNGAAMTLKQTATGTPNYNTAVTDYTVSVPAAAARLDLSMKLYTEVVRYGDEDAGYEVLVNGEPCSDPAAVSVPLSGKTDTQTVTLTVQNRYVPDNKTDYTLTIQKAEAVTTRFSLEPSDATLFLYESLSGNRVWPEADGSYALSDGFLYRYALTKPGYVSKNGAMQVTLQNGSAVLSVGAWNAGKLQNATDFDASKPVALTLTAAAQNPAIRHDLSAEWADFRGTAYTSGTQMAGTMNTNNGVVNIKAPVAADTGTLYWATKVGGDWENGGVIAPPILADGALISYAGKTICRLDPDTGEVLATGDMVDSSSFAINSATYYDGMVFVGLSGGRVQAFNAVTLESLWVYTDPYGGQPNCPITVCSGYLYTGFWNGESRPGSFVCLTVTDEDPTQKTEAKTASWRHVQDGGFYWAGAYACSDYVIVGSDDGGAHNSSLYLFDARTGAIFDQWDHLSGDIRTTVSYDGTAFYAASKGGVFYRVETVQDETGWHFTNKKTLNIGSACTSTPVIYNGRAYIGLGGEDFVPYGGYSIAVIDLDPNVWKIAYTVPTMGYVQASGLLTTAYAGDDGTVYVYFFENYTPGTMRLLRDRPGQTAPDYTTTETYLSKTYNAAYALFTPTGAHAQYAIGSPIVDAYGTIYFKNDSGYLMAFGSNVQSLTVTQDPDKTAYVTGDTFDATGVKITATLQNGLTRDVTAAMSASTAPLTANDQSVRLTLGSGWNMYHNKPNGSTMTTGEPTLHPYVDIPITVQDLGENGLIIESAASGRVTVRTSPKAAATLVCAAYDTTGKLLTTETAGISSGAQSVTLKLTGTLPKTYTVRCFLLDAQQRPLSAAVEKTIGK